MAERITSRTNPLMSRIRRLAVSRSFRRETGEFLGRGACILQDGGTWCLLIQKTKQL